MAVNSLGNFTFVRWSRFRLPTTPPDCVREESVLTQRPGVDGTGVIRTGTRGQPFEMLSGVDVATKTAAESLVASYRSILNNDRYILIWGGTDYRVTHNTLYVPLNVEVQQIAAMSGMSGGNVTGPGYWVEVLWTLLPVAV